MSPQLAMQFEIKYVITTYNKVRMVQCIYLGGVIDYNFQKIWVIGLVMRVLLKWHQGVDNSYGHCNRTSWYC